MANAGEPPIPDDPYYPWESRRGPTAWPLEPFDVTVASSSATPSLATLTFSAALPPAATGAARPEPHHGSSWDVVLNMIPGDAAAVRQFTLPGAYYAEFKVLRGEVNGDGMTDYIFRTVGGGNHGPCHECMFVSGPGDHVLVTLDNNGYRPAVWLDVNDDGRPELMWTSLVRGEAGRDGQEHNYFVHNLLEFDGARLVSANHRDPLGRFPAWIAYTFKANHTPTRQLTSAQRVRSWEQAWMAYTATATGPVDGEVVPPDFLDGAAFAQITAEQGGRRNWTPAGLWVALGAAAGILAATAGCLGWQRRGRTLSNGITSPA